MSKSLKRSPLLLLGFFASLVSCIVCDCRLDGKAAAWPVVTAIKRFRTERGMYPARLEQLVDAGFMDSIPDVPSNLCARRESLDYFADADLDMFCLSFLEQARFGGLGPVRVRELAYVSCKDDWVIDTPGRLDLTTELGLAMYCAGKRFRQEPISRNLDSFVSKTIFYASKNSGFPETILKHSLVETLGQGEAFNVSGKACLRYSSRDQGASAYCFVISRYSHLQENEYADRISEVLRLDTSASPVRVQTIYREPTGR